MNLPANPDEIIEIEDLIFILRGKRVMIDKDLAHLYGVETKHLNRQVRRNYKRFPEEYIFQLSEEEKKELVMLYLHFSVIVEMLMKLLLLKENIGLLVWMRHLHLQKGEAVKH
mgnify:CR=1 FL=1